MRRPDIVYLVAVAGVAFITLYPGCIHSLQPYFFIHSAGAYRLVSPKMAAVVIFLIPYLQIVLGICLVTNIATRMEIGIETGPT